MVFHLDLNDTNVLPLCSLAPRPPCILCIMSTVRGGSSPSGNPAVGGEPAGGGGGLDPPEKTCRDPLLQ